MNLLKHPKTLSFLSLGVVGLASFRAGDHGKYFEISKNIEIYTNLYKELNTYYVDEVDPAKLMRTGLDAMLNSLDPYTNYISESDIEGYRYLMEGKYSGIGVGFVKHNDFIVIVDPAEGSPAQKAGIKAGDKILGIDGKTAKGKDREEVEDILKGAPGTTVELEIARPTLAGTDKTLKIKIIRDELTEQNVPYSGMVSPEVGYIVLTTFTRDAGQNVANAFRELKEKNPTLKGVILDLRGNGGGLLHEAVNLCNIWIPKGQLVVTTKGKVVDWDRGYKTLNTSMDENMPLVVLVDKGTASASEIVSGTLQDYDRAVIMGQRSFGKGLVQNLRDIGYNSKLKLTTAKYYVPSGRCIQAVRYEKGKPVEIADSLRGQFKTSGGRIVLDGGGVKPDIMLDKSTDFGLLKELKDKMLIFDYVTQYVLKNEKAPNLETFKFGDFDDFVAFLDTKKFRYDSESEKLLKKLKENAEKEKYLGTIQTELKTMESKIQSDKKNDLLKHKDEIVSEIEREIIARHYFEKGQIKITLRNDSELTEAVQLLKDPTRYRSILKK